MAVPRRGRLAFRFAADRDQHGHHRYHRRDPAWLRLSRVAVTVGSTSWRTSIFPDSKTGDYWLPVKQAVRLAERLEVGDQVKAEIQLADL